MPPGKPVKHPRPFEDLVALARPGNSYNPSYKLKDQLRAIDILREEAADYKTQGDLENHYVCLGRAAAVIVDYLPTHPQHGLLSAKQQSDLANNGRKMLASLADLESQLRDRYRVYQAGIANGTIQRPTRRRTDEEEQKRQPPLEQQQAVTLPRTPTSIEDYTAPRTTSSNKPMPGVTVMLSEAQEKEKDRQRERERDRARGRDHDLRVEQEYPSNARSRETTPNPDKSSMPITPIPTPTRRDTITLSVSQNKPRAPSPGDRPRADPQAVQAAERELRAAMNRIQDDYNSQFNAILSDTTPMTETERMQRIIDLEARTGGAERKYIEDKSARGRAAGFPPTFEREMDDQIVHHSQRMDVIRRTFRERDERNAQRRAAESKARVEAETRALEQRLKSENDSRRANALRERQLQEAVERDRSDNERRNREDTLRRERDVAATQEALQRVKLAERQRAEEAELEAAKAVSRDRQAAADVQAKLAKATAQRAARESFTKPLSTSQISRNVDNDDVREYPNLRQASPNLPPRIETFAQLSATEHDQRRLSPIDTSGDEYHRRQPSRVPPVHPAVDTTRYTRPSDSTILPVSPRPPSTRTGARSPSNSSGSIWSKATPTHISRDRADRDPSVTSHSGHLHLARGMQEERLAAVEALPIESPTRSFISPVEDYRDVTKPSRYASAIPITTTTMSPLQEHRAQIENSGLSTSPGSLLPDMTNEQKTQGYAPSKESIFQPLTPPLSSDDGGTPNGLLFQPNGVTEVPPPVRHDRSLGGPMRHVPMSRPMNAPSPRPSIGGSSSMSATSPYPYNPAPHHAPSISHLRGQSSFSISNNGRLRPVCLPTETLPRFVALAAINTAKKKETLGILCGKPNAQGGFEVTTLFIPKQNSTENNCTMTNEELLVEFQESRGTIVLGWIHTHPTQSCFMSSMDLHTHSRFQSDLPEAIAIVCAPRSKPNFGIFRLTDPPGLEMIMSCRDSRDFHPHSDRDPIYTDADSNHVRMMSNERVEIVDLR